MADLGTVTITEDRVGPIKKIRFAWTSENGGDNAGKAQKTTTYFYNGKVLHLMTDPDGSVAPTDNYDVQLLDKNSEDVLAGGGADRDTANTEYVGEASLGCAANTQLTLSVTNAGNAKQGVVSVYIR